MSINIGKDGGKALITPDSVSVSNWYYAHKEFFPSDGELGQLYIRVSLVIFLSNVVNALSFIRGSIIQRISWK